MKRTILMLWAGLFVVLLCIAAMWFLARNELLLSVLPLVAVLIAILQLLAQVGLPWSAKPTDVPELLARARELVAAVGKRVAEEQNRLLADASAGIPADVSLTPVESAWAEDLVTWRSGNGSQSGSLRNIADFYTGSQRRPAVSQGRLVVVGGEGSGKTVLVNQLLLDIVSCLRDGASGPSGALQVPVRLSLASFDPGPPENRDDVDAVTARLESWMADSIHDAYGTPAVIATQLVKGNWILPILDGLDEMDAAGEVSGAAAVIRALNRPSGHGVRRVVVTCRTGKYVELADWPTEPGDEAVLQDAAVVEIEPLTARQSSSYIASRFRSYGVGTEVQRRWQVVLDHLIAEPDSPLAAVLASPRYLFMAVNVYYDLDTRPSELIGLRADEIEMRLLDGFIRAVAFQNRDPGRRRSASDVTHWLTTVAWHLYDQRRRGGSSSDLSLSTLWTAAGSRAPRFLSAALIGAIEVALLFATASTFVHRVGAIYGGSGVLASVLRWLFIPVPFFLPLIAVTETLSLDPVHPPPDLSWAASRIRQRKLSLLTIAAAFALYAARVWVFGPGLPKAVIPNLLALAIGVPASIGFQYAVRGALGPNEEQPGIDRPSRAVSRGTANAFLAVFGGCLVLGFLAAPLTGVATGLEIALMMTLIYASPWVRYLFATQILAWRRQLPARPAAFLDWAYQAGLLRISGDAIQFRHRELQGYLYLASCQQQVAEELPRSRPARRSAAASLCRCGSWLVEIGRNEDALLAFRLAVCSDPDSEWGYYGLGNALAALDQHQEAADAYKRAIQLNQKDRAVPFRPTGDTWFRLGCSLEVLGLDDEATKALAEGDCRTLPRLALANASFQYVAWGQDLEAECRYESALYAFDQAIQRNPRSLRAHCGLGRVLAALGRDGEALESFDQAVDRHPHCRLAHHCRAKALDRLGRREEADEAYKRAKTTRESESPHQQEIQSPS